MEVGEMVYELIQARIGVSWIAFVLSSIAIIMVVVGAVSMLRSWVYVWRGWVVNEVPPEAGEPVAPLPRAYALSGAEDRGGDIGRKAPAAMPTPPKIPERTFSCLPGGGRRRFGRAEVPAGGPPTPKPRESWPTCNVCGAGPFDICDTGLHS